MSDQWNGLSMDGGQISMSHAALMMWALDNDMQFTAGWRCDFTFPEDKVSNAALKGARIVRKGPDRPTYEEAARQAGWIDMAELFREAGL